MAVLKEITLLLVAYSIAFIISTTLIVYILHIPTFITGQQKMVNEYYYDNFLSSTLLDYFLVFAYLLVAQCVLYGLNANYIAHRLTLVIVTTLCISGGFYLYFKSKPLDKTSFFSRWFYNAGFSAVVYDIVLLTVTYSVLMVSLVKTKDRLKEWLG